MWKLLWITTFVHPKSPAVTILKVLLENFQFLQLSITWNYSNSYVYGIYYISYLEWHASKFMRLSITAVVRVGTFQHYLLPTHVWCCRQTSCNQATIRPTIQPTIHFGNQPQNWNLRLPFDETQDFFSIAPLHSSIAQGLCCQSSRNPSLLHTVDAEKQQKKKQRLKSAMSSIDCCHTRYE